MGPPCKLIEPSRRTGTLVRAQEIAAADAWAWRSCGHDMSAGAILPRGACQSPKGNWIAFKYHFNQAC